MATPIGPGKPWSKKFSIKCLFRCEAILTVRDFFLTPFSLRKILIFLFRQKRPFKLTRGGWIFILYTIGIGAGAINTGNNLIYLIFGIFLGLILTSGALSDLTLWGLSAVISFPKSGRAGELLLIPVQIFNSKKWFPSLSVRIEIEGKIEDTVMTLVSFCPAVERAGSAPTLLSCRPRKRGWFQTTKIKFTTRFPFGLLTKSWTVARFESGVDFDSHQGTLVLPTLLSIDPSFLRSNKDQDASLLSAPKKGDGASLFGIRTYQPSDNPRRIHWRASAKRTSGWLVREMEHEQDEHIYLHWPESFQTDWDRDKKELFISFVASIVDDFEKRKIEPHILIQSGSRKWTASGDLLWGFLSLIDPGGTLNYRTKFFLSPWHSDPFEGFSKSMDLMSCFEIWQQGNPNHVGT